MPRQIIFSASLVALFFIVQSCSNAGSKSISFADSNYTLIRTRYNMDSSERDESYVNKQNNLVTMLKSYLNVQNKIQAWVFYYNKQRFGPYKLYDTAGHLSYSSFSWGNIDSSRFEFDSVNMILKQR